MPVIRYPFGAKEVIIKGMGFLSDFTDFANDVRELRDEVTGTFRDTAHSLVESRDEIQQSLTDAADEIKDSANNIKQTVKESTDLTPETISNDDISQNDDKADQS